MKPSELYARPPIKTDTDLSVLFGFYFNHMPEVKGVEYQQSPQNNQRIEVRYYADHSYDGRRIWRLCSFWLDGKPFMITQNAGREGDDHFARFITNVATYSEAVGYVQTLIAARTNEKTPDVYVEPDAEIEGLTDFYSDSLETVGKRW